MDDFSVKNKQGGIAGIEQTSSAAKNQKPAAKKPNELGQEEFLKILVNQLQHQDPLNPLDSQQFAAQLAQFSSLEQLISINNKIEGQGTGNVSSMASFLGHQVVTNEDVARVSAGQGPSVLLDIPAGSTTARIDLIDENGQVVDSKQFDGLRSGRQVLSLSGVNVPDGSYELRAVAVERSGQFAELEPKITGTVEGFVLQPDPALIVGGEQIKLEDVVEVFSAPKVPSSSANS